MPRQPRFWCPGAVLHVIQRGNSRSAVFVTDDDRATYLAFLGSAANAHGMAIHAYVLMSNQVHLLVSPKRNGVRAVILAVPERIPETK